MTIRDQTGDLSDKCSGKVFHGQTHWPGLALVGIGKNARGRNLPAIAASRDECHLTPSWLVTDAFSKGTRIGGAAVAF
ncbi:hypothetical protein [Polymorphobacter fuscus]|uniref:Uncharacterized protein n=1 Tax=Sandarakinorhabdus fusca TaxID=1439888 RepID=A0A7C9KY21_9SPHN|nr:hypothetical protein [Polymorphobacter fuscus]KAB7645558.1 hypothetical protein F9290_12115 [Polymorphobacter fuscus]MQT18002.1 hypothetical protein [Polymorphobacter fuscus]NJC08631.1 hypothetical protein [Polymorphobacter fuscus]